MTASDANAFAPAAFIPDSSEAWRRLVIALGIASVGSVGMWSVVVALPKVQADFGGTRADASLAFTFAMLGFGIGNLLMGQLADRRGIVPAIVLGVVSLLMGYLAAAISTTLWQFALVHVAIGFGSSATFGPLMAEASHWFIKRRGIAVTIAASGNYLGGAIWPPIIEHSMGRYGWQATHIGIGVFCAVSMTALLLFVRSGMTNAHGQSGTKEALPTVNLGLRSNALTAILSLAGLACCVAMAIPQAHTVAYCGDLGYGAARGAEMLSVMLAFGIVSRIASGFIADRLGGLTTLLIGSIAQTVALTFYLFFDGLTSLYVLSAMFGLFQGGLVPSYAIIVRETMPASEAATRLGMVFMASVIGMSFGGWISGVIVDSTGSYRAAFLNGVAWNGLNIGIVLLLLFRAAQPNVLARS